MATLDTGTNVRLAATAAAKLRLAPLGVDLFIAVHAGALKSPANLHTQVVGFTSAGLAWAAGLGEDLLESGSRPARSSARDELRKRLLPIAIPLNDASNPKWYSPLIAAGDIGLTASKDSQAERAHAWTVRQSASTIGHVQPNGIRAVRHALETFYG